LHPFSFSVHKLLRDQLKVKPEIGLLIYQKQQNYMTTSK
jgi:hypothetical protein